ncbi:tyrosine-type recombinase/integrase [Paraburkholderia nodosa]|uniref:tyrosine-type recombinase/integrase n=1 Tax=Paraburkholderia nodosa TaxID=392320 RepID=UPI00159F1F51
MHWFESKARIWGDSSHSDRPTFATTLIEKGVDTKAASTLMGHVSIAITARYVEDNPVRSRSVLMSCNVGDDHHES